MSIYSIPYSCIPFTGQDGLSYILNEKGQIVRVNFQHPRSQEIWSTFLPGTHGYAEDNSELNTALQQLFSHSSERMTSVPPNNKQLLAVYGSTGLSEKLNCAIQQSGITSEIVELDQVTSDHACLLVAAGYFQWKLFQRIEAELAPRDIAWLPVYTEGALVRIGPLMGPYLTLECLTKRLLSASSSPAVQEDLWNYTEKLIYPEQIFTQAEEQWYAAVIALLLDQWMTKKETLYPLDKFQITLSPHSRSIDYHPVLRLPLYLTHEGNEA